MPINVGKIKFALIYVDLRRLSEAYVKIANARIRDIHPGVISC